VSVDRYVIGVMAAYLPVVRVCTAQSRECLSKLSFISSVSLSIFSHSQRWVYLHCKSPLLQRVFIRVCKCFIVVWVFVLCLLTSTIVLYSSSDSVTRVPPTLKSSQATVMYSWEMIMRTAKCRAVVEVRRTCCLSLRQDLFVLNLTSGTSSCFTLVPYTGFRKSLFPDCRNIRSLFLENYPALRQTTRCGYSDDHKTISVGNSSWKNRGGMRYKFRCG